MPPCPTGIPQTPAGPCPASVGDDARIVPQTLRCRRPQAAGENARPALRPGTGNNAEEAAPTRPVGGPMQASAPTQALRADGGMRRPAAPRFYRLFALHCRAGVHARRGPCPTGIPQTPAGPCPASVGDDACIVLQTLRCRKPQAAGENARPALRPGTGDNAEEAAPRQARRRADASIGPCAGVASGREHAAACRRPRFCRLFTLHCRAGVHARRGPCGGPEGYWQGKAPHPSVG